MFVYILKLEILKFRFLLPNWKVFWLVFKIIKQLFLVKLTYYFSSHHLLLLIVLLLVFTMLIKLLKSLVLILHWSLMSFHLIKWPKKLWNLLQIKLFLISKFVLWDSWMLFPRVLLARFFVVCCVMQLLKKKRIILINLDCKNLHITYILNKRKFFYFSLKSFIGYLKTNNLII